VFLDRQLFVWPQYLRQRGQCLLYKEHSHICTLIFMSSVVLFLSDLNLSRNKRTDFLRTLNVEFHEKLFSGNRIVACGLSDQHDEASILCLLSERT